MINTLQELKRRSIALGLCDRYKGEWDSCTTPRELYDMATDINGLEYLCDATTFGWGGPFDCNYIKERFSDFVNGAYKRDKDGYTTALYCAYEGLVTARDTVVCLLDCKGSVIVPPNEFVTIMVGAGSDVYIANMGRINELVVFGDAKVRGARKAEKRTLIQESRWRKDS